MTQEHTTAPATAEKESPLEHIVQHPLIERPANLGPLTPNGTITLFSDQIAMIALAGVLLWWPAEDCGHSRNPGHR